MGFLRTFGATLGAGLAEILLDRIAPPGKSPLQQVLDAAPALFGLVKMMRDGAPTDHDVIDGHVVPRDIAPLVEQQRRYAEAVANYEERKGHPVSAGHGLRLRPEDFPPVKKLGEFTCPKCGGNTWSWTGVHGVDENGTHIRMCSGWRLVNPDAKREDRDFGCSDRCDFTWKATDDHLYFSSVEVGPAREHTCVGAAQPEQDIASLVDLPCGPRGPLFSQRRLADRYDELERHLIGFVKKCGDAVGDARRNDGEHPIDAAVRLLGEADAFIGRQSKEIARQAEVIRNYAFDVGGGEIRVSEQDTLVLLGGNWTLRHDDGSVVTSVPLGAKEAADHLSTATGVPFSAHVIGSPAGPLMEKYAGDPETRREIRASIAAPEAVDVSCKEYVERQAPRYARETVMMEHKGCDKCGAERGRKCSVDCASTDRLKEKP